MYAKVSDKVVIEELAKLKDKIRAIQFLRAYLQLITEKYIAPIRDLDNSQAIKLKGQLFNYYSLVEDYEKYNTINDSLIRYKNNVREVASLDDIKLQNTLILNWRNQEKV